MNRPILLGMNNPLSRRPEHALYPAPSGCTGWRLWSMLHARTGATKHEYLEVFDRRNLLSSQQWKMADARQAAEGLCGELESVRPELLTVVVLGAEPAAALGLSPQPLILPFHRGGVLYRRLPHPSGRNLWYNDPAQRAVAELLLEELYTTYREATACTPS